MHIYIYIYIYIYVCINIHCYFTQLLTIINFSIYRCIYYINLNKFIFFNSLLVMELPDTRSKLTLLEKLLF